MLPNRQSGGTTPAAVVTAAHAGALLRAASRSRQIGELRGVVHVGREKLMRFAVGLPWRNRHDRQSIMLRVRVDYLRQTRGLKSVGILLLTLSAPSQPQPQAFAQQR